jgi:hypothetical protein
LAARGLCRACENLRSSGLSDPRCATVAILQACRGMCARYQHISMHGLEAFQNVWIHVHVKTETRSLCAALLCDCAQPGTCTAVACQTGLIVRQVVLDCSMSSFCIVYCRWQWNRLFAQLCTVPEQNRQLTASLQPAAGHELVPAMHQSRAIHIASISGQTISLLRLA